MSNKKATLNELGQWVLFRGLACHVMEKFGLTEDELGCSLWEFTESLDMSFDEIKNLPIERWGNKVLEDVTELKNDIAKQH